MTIVARNDPPDIEALRPEFDATEDLLTDIKGISVKDVDLMETITSSLAHELWMDDAENRQYNDAMAVEVSVQYGRMFLGGWAKLNVIRDAVQEYVSLAGVFSGHDVCRLSDYYKNPPGSSQAYEDVCAHMNAGTADCTTGDTTNKIENPNCMCSEINLCGTDKYLVLYLNRSKDFADFRSSLKEAVVGADRTCGGLPVGPDPNNYTLGKACTTSRDCSTAALPRCGSPDYPCFCCANLSMTCSSGDDCREVEKDSFCGCRPDAQGQGVCGPYFDTGGRPVLFDASIPGYPRTADGHPTAKTSHVEVERFGSRCTYVGKATKQVPTDICLPAAYLKGGSQAEAVISPLTVNGVGSRSIKFYAALDDLNRALDKLAYKTRPYFSRLYRKPLAERGPNYDPAIDSVDTLSVVGDDLGNSGGMERDVQTTQRDFNIYTKAVNNEPSISGPERISANEDLSLRVTMDQQHDGTRIVTAGWAPLLETGFSHIYVWDLRSGEPVLNFAAHEDVINQVALTRDDKYVVSCSGTFEPGEDVVKVDYSIRVFETMSGLELHKLPKPSLKLNQGHILGVKCVAVNDDSTMIVSGGYDMAVCLWDMQTGKMLNRIGGMFEVKTSNDTIVNPPKTGHRDVVTGVAFYDIADPDEMQLARAISVSDDRSIRLYDLTNAFGTELQCIGPASAGCQFPSRDGHEGPITGLAVMNNAVFKLLATSSEDGTIILWKLGRSALTKWKTVNNFNEHVVAVSLLPGAALFGRVPRPLLVGAGGRRSPYSRTKYTPVADTAVQVFDLETLEVMSRVETNLVHFAGMPINTVGITPDGKRVVTANDDGKVAVLDVTDAEVVTQLPCPCICATVVVQDPWSRCQEAPCREGCKPSPVWPSRVVSTFALFNNPIMVTDPDSMDYGFDNKIFRFNASCNSGKLFITESFLKQERRCTNDRSLCKGNRDCLSDDGNNGLCKDDPPRIAVYEIEEGRPPRQGIHRRPTPVRAASDETRCQPQTCFVCLRCLGFGQVLSVCA